MEGGSKRLLRTKANEELWGERKIIEKGEGERWEPFEACE